MRKSKRKQIYQQKKTINSKLTRRGKRERNTERKEGKKERSIEKGRTKKELNEFFSYFSLLHINIFFPIL